MDIKKEDTADFIAPNLLKHKIKSGLVGMYSILQNTVKDAFEKEMRGKKLSSGELYCFNEYQVPY